MIQQTNAHVGLVFSPDGSTLYAAGGRDDPVYAYTQERQHLGARAATIALGHADEGLGISVSPNASGLGISRRRQDAGRRQQLQRLDQRDRHGERHRPLRARPAPVSSPATRALNGGVGGTFPFAVVVKGNGTAYVSSDRDREVVVVDISSPTAGRLIKRIKLDGNALGMTLDAVGLAGCSWRRTTPTRSR